MNHGEPQERDPDEVGPVAAADYAQPPEATTESGETGPDESGPPANHGDGRGLQSEVEALAARLRSFERRNSEALQGVATALETVNRRLDAVRTDSAQDGEAAPAPERFAALESSVSALAARMEDIADTLAAVSGDVETARQKLDAVADKGEDDAAPESQVGETVATLSQDLDKLKSALSEADMTRQDALESLKERLAAREKTADETLGKIGHAVSVIADRIDDLDSRIGGLESGARASGFAAKGGPKLRDDTVAPYIANVERELQGEGGGGGIDIFDKIAQAAEAEFDQSRGGHAQRLQALKDDRRVGTKKWTPSRVAKKRLEAMENGAAAAASADAPPPPSDPAVQPQAAAPDPDELEIPDKPAAQSLADLDDTPRVVRARRQRAPEVEEDWAEAAADADADADESAAEEAAPALVAGERGRRRSRARKSAMDEEFASVFDEDEGKPSIGGLRRKLRSGSSATGTTAIEESYGADPEEVDDAAPAARAGLFSRLLGKGKAAPARGRSARKREDLEDREDDEDALMAAFDEDPDIDEDEDAWEDALENENKSSLTRTLLLLLIFAAVVGGYFLLRGRGMI